MSHSITRHAERVSASTGEQTQPAQGTGWALKHVQGDANGACQTLNFLNFASPEAAL
jgi:hypothetical protein